MYMFEIKKELLVGFSLSILYITYYLVEVVKKPILICREGEFRKFLEENVPLLSEHYWPTPWCVESRLQTVLGSILRSRLLPPVKYRRQVLRLSDGGQVALDWVESAGPARAVLLAREAERVALLVTARGGHIGFLEGWWPARAARDQYIARLATQYFAALLARADLLHAAPDC
uniref:Uncharacterized protein n=1 Tax=Heliothis virescens TaxID=7102 RepID=A0A2A4JIK4_HELVI